MEVSAMSYKKKLNKYASDIGKKLDELLTPELHLNVETAMRYSTLGGGKRLRGAMVMEFAHMTGGNPDAALYAAAAIEMVHAYSLIHDDLPCMDDDDMRRGQLSCHKMFGEAPALLAGDALLTKAFETLALSFEILAPEKIVALVGELSQAAGAQGMIAGQELDLIFEKRTPSRKELDAMISMKTGELFTAACTMGCTVGDATDEQVMAAVEYAEKLALAFQIRDDMLDIEGDAAELGKATGADARQGKTSYPALISMDECRKEVKRLTDEAVAALAAFPDNEFMIELTKGLATRTK
jgi:geranylgeranyl diphosphate synthase type II